MSCEINGEAANFCDTGGVDKPSGEIRFYSQETAVKAKIADEANQNLRARFSEIFKIKNLAQKIGGYRFPLEVDKLGQKSGENYFAIIHVDGNNMGVKFRTCDSLSARRKLSREIRRKTEGAFAELLAKIIALKEAGAFDKCLTLEKNFLPIRPLIIGGDDVTFLCPAKMAVIFTKALMENLSAETPGNAPEHLTSEISRRIDCCAGIAILHGEQAPTLEQIRETEYCGARVNLHFGPYRVANENAPHAADRRYNLENLLACTAQFLSETMAKNKIKELRGILQHGRDDVAKFLQQLKYQGQNLPDVADWREFLTDNLWSAGEMPQTPYVDAIELMDFYVPEVAGAWKLQ